MIRNYLTVALRHIFKNKLYAVINILGLTVGLSVYIFGSLLANYEKNHDVFYEKADRIFTAGSVFSPAARESIGIGEADGIYTAFGPLIESDAPEIEAVARSVRSEYLVSIDDNHYYETIRFVDPALTKIFDFNYLAGDENTLQDPSSVLITEDSAEKLFGDKNAAGRIFTLDHDVTLTVGAVIENLPPNTHFNSGIIYDADIGIVAPLAALNKADEFDLAGGYDSLSMGDLTYILAPEGKSIDWVQTRIDGVYDSHYIKKDPDKEFIVGLKVRPLKETNTILWDAIGMPILQSVQILAFLVLLVAIVNYTNLATAQSLSRAREVGLRKTMGAARSQLLVQFLIESLCIAAIAMLFALVVLEVAIPQFNTALDKGLEFNYLVTLPWILTTTFAVGLVAGAYPAYLITRSSPIDALHETSQSGTKGGVFRNLMLGLQFTVSIFMLAIVMIVYFQNKKVEDAGDMYPKSQIVTLQRLGLETIQARMDTLRNELLMIPGVQNVSYSSQLPYQQSTSQFGATRVLGDEDNAIMMMHMRIDGYFLDTYNIPLLAGRNLSTEISADTVKKGALDANILVNELTLKDLGFGAPDAALGQVFYDTATQEEDGREARAYTIVGVLPDQNIQGFHNQIKPMTFMMQPESMQFASVKVSGVPMHRVLSDIESTWNDLVPDYPIQTQFLDETFNEVFQVFDAMMKVLGGFALVALLLSLIGLFGLAAFMAQIRTREIGIRKVMGASIAQIVRLLVWQFSRPVLWSLLIALPLAYLASNTYLDFFADRIDTAAGIVFVAGVLGVIFSWVIVAMHAVRIARANPIVALRYE